MLSGSEVVWVLSLLYKMSMRIINKIIENHSAQIIKGTCEEERVLVLGWPTVPILFPVEKFWRILT